MSDRPATPEGVADPLFAVVDVETSGLSPRRHRILQIGLATVAADGTIVDHWSTLVRLRWPLQRVGPTSVHGIRRRTLRGAPRLDDSLRELARRIDGLTVVGHNVGFDAAFLRRAAARTQMSLPLDQRVCTLELSRALDPEGEQSHTLGDVTARYDVTIEKQHDALADAIATAAVLPPLLDAHGIDRTAPGPEIHAALQCLRRELYERAKQQRDAQKAV